MAMTPLHKDLSPIDLPLSSIYLDPNNPRFTEANWEYVNQADWDKSEVQEHAQRRLVSDFGIEKLRMSMEVNGFLPIDRVIVARFADDKYVVLEGNRRICAAKMIGALSVDGSEVDGSVAESLSSIPCLVYTGTDGDAAWIFQGLRHISGVAEWSAYNKAKLLVEQMSKEGLSLTAVGKRFGLTAYGAGQWVRGYKAFMQARESSDYIGEVDERAYPYFQELFGRSAAPLREWLGWDEAGYQFSDNLKFDEFISWLYPRGGEDDGARKKGDFDSRRIARRDDLRQLSALLINDVEYFEQFRRGVALDNCYSLSLARKYEEEAKRQSDPLRDLLAVVDQCVKVIGDVPYRAMRNNETRASILKALEKLEVAISEVKA